MELLEKNSRKEEEDLEDKWETDIHAFRVKSKEEFDAMYKSQAEEMKKITKGTNKQGKKALNSKLLLELKAAEKNLVRQERFLEADKIKKEIKKEEAKIAKKQNLEGKSKVNFKMDRLSELHLKQIEAMKVKFRKKLHEMEVQRDTELKNLLTRYKNKKEELVSAQKKEFYINENPNLLLART